MLFGPDSYLRGRSLTLGLRDGRGVWNKRYIGGEEARIGLLKVFSS